MTRRNKTSLLSTDDNDTTPIAQPPDFVPAPSTFNDGLPLPKMIVFDLDYTLWPFWVDTHVSAPLRRTANGLTVKDSYGGSFGFYTDVAGVLAAIRDKDIKVGAASRTCAPELAREMLSYLTIPGEGCKALSMFDFLEIYPGSKTTHFAKLQKSSGIAYEEMLFFDDESRNRNVEQLGVVMQLVRDGVSRAEMDKGVQAWRKRNNRTAKED
ncbi:magnesium-dependent phosphatase-1 [Polychaeton citri CBS 116435]|uniref:Magnesium-dependent phosphatase-1 n=1 Tax=Polychaeton citri CBS 116435 TaxID=1314669 RepID=A0A9P4QH74_9PEZI|nr:magnesium-dependent phosphatase-1 [Polychaeton citri CBS 116435]